MCGNLGDSKRVPLMDVFIDGVLWHRVRYFQVFIVHYTEFPCRLSLTYDFKVSPQWQTHVKMFPVSFPLVPTVNVWPISC